MSPNNIYQSINAMMADIPAIGKDQRNAQQGFMYRGIDVVMNVLQPLLSKHGIFVVPEVLSHDREERATKNGGNLIYSVIHVKYTFYAQDGSSVTASVIGEGMDSADKSSNKAMSVAFKYACFQVFCIPTEEMKDPNEVTPPPSEPKPAAQKPAAQKSEKASAPESTEKKDSVPLYVCEDCRTEFKAGELNGIKYSAQEAYDQAFKMRGRHVCQTCFKKAKKVNLNELPA